MAFGNYTDLKASVLTWSKRPDALALLDDFILIAEEEMYANPDNPLRLNAMDTRSTASVSTSDRFLGLPTGFLGMRRLNLNLAQGDCDVKYMAPDQLNLQGTSGIPRFFTVTSQLGFDRTPDSAYAIEMQYWAKPTGLSSSNATNTVITNFPTIYLYGCLWALWQFFKEEELSEFYYNKFMNGVRGANKQDKDGRYGSAPFIRMEGSTP